ncbi:MAG: sigma-54 dependent transcriptional regulator [Thermodesulforhabdaceae bacterium]
MLYVALVDDEIIVQKRLRSLLEKEGYTVDVFSSGEEFLKELSVTQYDLVFLDIMLPGINGMEVLEQVKIRQPNTEVIMITGYASIGNAVEAIKKGAFHYVAKPLRLEEIRNLARKVFEQQSLRRENRQLKSRLDPVEGWGEMIGISPPMKEVFRLIRKVAPLDCNVLIQGESGTGKELVARLIHRESPRRDRPFVAFNCGGFTEELIASELFGYERGAFTGAVATKIGILETANRGTVFMDEIGDMPLSMQGKLLRVIQEKVIMRVGGNRPIQLDVRFIAATNKDLKKAVLEGEFREDLYFRLNVVQINLPPLSERKEDIPLLVQHFINQFSHKFGKKIAGISPEAKAVLMSYSYPGNVRELGNIIERSVALAESDVITLSDLPPDLQEYGMISNRQLSSLEEIEKEHIRKVLSFTNHQLGKAAKILGLSRTTLWRKLKKYGLSDPDQQIQTPDQTNNFTRLFR